MARKRKTHGCYKTPEYAAWSKMKGRCNNPKDAKFYLYGARGIRVCRAWAKFERFLADMGKRPTDKHSLGRIDGRKGYNKTNCRWETLRQQQGNLSTNRWLRFRGRRLTVADWARELGVRVGILRNRLYYGWSVSRTLETPLYGSASDGRTIGPPKKLTHRGKTQSLPEWAKELNIPIERLYHRRAKGMPTELILSEKDLRSRQE